MKKFFFIFLIVFFLSNAFATTYVELTGCNNYYEDINDYYFYITSDINCIDSNFLIIKNSVNVTLDTNGYHIYYNNQFPNNWYIYNDSNEKIKILNSKLFLLGNYDYNIYINIYNAYFYNSFLFGEHTNIFFFNSNNLDNNINIYDCNFYGGYSHLDNLKGINNFAKLEYNFYNSNIINFTIWIDGVGSDFSEPNKKGEAKVNYIDSNINSSELFFLVQPGRNGETREIVNFIHSNINDFHSDFSSNSCIGGSGDMNYNFMDSNVNNFYLMFGGQYHTYCNFNIEIKDSNIYNSRLFPAAAKNMYYFISNSFLYNTNLYHIPTFTYDSNRNYYIVNSFIENSIINNNTDYNINNNITIKDSNLLYSSLYNIFLKDNVTLIDNNYYDINFNNINIIDSNISSEDIKSGDKNIFTYNTIFSNTKLYFFDVYDVNDFFGHFINNNELFYFNIYSFLNIDTNIRIYDSNFYNYNWNVDKNYSLGKVNLDFNLYKYYDGNLDLNVFKYCFDCNSHNDENMTIDTNNFDFNYTFNLEFTNHKIDFIRFSYTDENGNYYDPIVELGGKLHSCIRQEDNNNILTVNTFTIDGNSVLSDYNATTGCGVFDFSGDGKHTIYIDTNIGSRTYYLYLDDNYEYDYNFYILDDDDKENIEFTFYDEDGENKLSDTYIYVVYGNTNYVVDAGQTNSNGEITFELDPNETDYNFWVDVDGNIKYYKELTLTIKIPKDEQTGSAISPFTVRITGINSYYNTGLTADKNYTLLTNTTNNHGIYISASGYYERNYDLIFRGDEDTYTLQPYLTATDDSIALYFYVKNKITQTPLENIEIYLYKNISGHYQLVSSALTDSTGTGTVIALALEKYKVVFKKDGVTVKEAQIYANTSNFYVYLVLSTDGEQDTTTYNVDIEINNNEYISYIDTDTNTYIIPVSITSDDMTRVDINYYWNDSNSGSIVAYPSPSTYDTNVIISDDVDITHLIKICVKVYKDSDQIAYKCKSIRPSDSRSTWNPGKDIVSYFENVDNMLINVLLAIFLSMLLIGAVSMYIRDSMTLYVVGFVVFGGFITLGLFTSSITSIIIFLVVIGILYYLGREI